MGEETKKIKDKKKKNQKGKCFAASQMSYHLQNVLAFILFWLLIIIVIGIIFTPRIPETNPDDFPKWQIFSE